jgi:hypothetical protein
MPTLSFGSTNPVAITGTAAGTATLTVSTTAPTTAGLNTAPRGLYGSAGTLLALILLFGIPAHRRRCRSYLALLVLAILGYGAFGCGGGSAKSTGGGTSGTTPGTYTVTITGTSGALSTNATLHIIVQ